MPNVLSPRDLVSKPDNMGRNCTTHYFTGFCSKSNNLSDKNNITIKIISLKIIISHS